jgi:hypothetical protein
MFSYRFLSCLLASFATLLGPAASAANREPVPDRLVALTFDDSVKSQSTVARPVPRAQCPVGPADDPLQDLDAIGR